MAEDLQKSSLPVDENQQGFLWQSKTKLHWRVLKGIQSYEMQPRSIPFLWEISLAHIKRGYSGPGNDGGVCSSVAYVMSGGSPNSHCLLHYVLKFIMSIQEIILISQNSCLKIINSVFYVLIILFTNLLPLCLGFP